MRRIEGPVDSSAYPYIVVCLFKVRTTVLLPFIFVGFVDLEPTMCNFRFDEIIQNGSNETAPCLSGAYTMIFKLFKVRLKHDIITYSQATLIDTRLGITYGITLVQLQVATRILVDT